MLPAPGARPPCSQRLIRARARLAELEGALDAEILQRAALEERVVELAAQIEAIGQRPARISARRPNFSAGGPDPAAIDEKRASEFRADAGARNQRGKPAPLRAERLTAQGFAPDRAEWIIRRTEELRMQALQAQYDAAARRA